MMESLEEGGGLSLQQKNESVDQLVIFAQIKQPNQVIDTGVVLFQISITILKSILIFIEHRCQIEEAYGIKEISSHVRFNQNFDNANEAISRKDGQEYVMSNDKTIEEGKPI